MSLLEDLREALNGYLNRSKGNTLRSLSLKSGVPYSTLYKIHSGEIENPQLDTVMKLLREGVNVKAERLQFIQKHYPYMYDLIDLTDSRDKKTLEKKTNDPEIDALFKERDSFFLMYFLFAKCGITLEDARASYGNHGLALLDDLANRDLVMCEDGVWRANFEYDFSTLEANKQHIVNAVATFKQESVPLGCGLIHTLSEGVSLAGARAITLEIKHCLNRLREIRDHHPGDYVFIANFVMQLLNPPASPHEKGPQ